jgi:hypothetical protein
MQELIDVAAAMTEQSAQDIAQRIAEYNAQQAE